MPEQEQEQKEGRNVHTPPLQLGDCWVILIGSAGKRKEVAGEVELQVELRS